MGLPGLIGDSFFRVLDSSKDGYIDQTELINGLSRIYFGVFEEKVKFIFEMYDFDGNGIITKEDIRTMLSYVPLSAIESDAKKEGLYTQNGGGIDAFYDRMQIQADLIQLFNCTLKDKQSINLEEFKLIVCKSSSDMFLCLFMLIRERLPSMKAFLTYKKDFKSTDKAGTPSAVLASPKMSKLSPSLKVLSQSPYLKSVVGKAPTASSDLFKKYLPIKGSPEKKKLDLPKYEDPKMEEMPEQLSIPDSLNGSSTSTAPEENKEMGSAVRLPNKSVVIKTDKDVKKTEYMLSPSAFLDKRKINTSMAVCSCGKMCTIGSTMCEDCSQKGKTITGNIYIKKDNKLKRHWAKLSDKTLFGRIVISL
jgi:Ca2+-binding EF-hand superfamily protein